MIRTLFVSAPLEHIKRERVKSSRLKKTRWWREKINQGQCYHCEKKFNKKELSMDHLIPLARGGHSLKNNIVVSCLKCNAKKKHNILLKSH